MTDTYGSSWLRRLLEIQGLLIELENLTSGLDRDTYDQDKIRRWAIHRLWIAVGVEAGLYRQVPGAPRSTYPVWTQLCKQRNDLAHQPLPVVDEDLVWRTTSLRLGQLRRMVDDLLA